MSSQSKTPMSEEKKKRIVVAMTAAGVFLVIFLVIILVVQFVQIGVKKSTENELEKQLELLKDKIESGERDLEFYLSLEGLEHLALQNGWIKGK